MERPQWTTDEVHTAMCLWEAYQELQGSGDYDLRKQLDAIREAHGTCSLRLLLIDMVKDCDIAWEAKAALNGDAESFDWDFVPEFLAGQVRSGRLTADAAHQWQVLNAS